MYLFKYLRIFVHVSPHTKVIHSHYLREMTLWIYFFLFISYLFQNVCNKYVCAQINIFFK